MKDKDGPGWGSLRAQLRQGGGNGGLAPRGVEAMRLDSAVPAHQSLEPGGPLLLAVLPALPVLDRERSDRNPGESGDRMPVQHRRAPVERVPQPAVMGVEAR